MRALAIVLICVSVREASAQSTEVDPIGPARCFDLATDEGLESLNALQLCVGAISEAPARCYERATDDLVLSDLQAVRLCRMAVSESPATCAARLDATTTLSDPQIVRYCAAQQWPTLPAPHAGSPACIRAALDRTMLSDHDAFALCRGSTSDGPVTCYEWADDNLLAATDDLLVQLCSSVVAYPILGGLL